MAASFLAELLKLRKRPALWLIVAVWLVLTVVFNYVFPYMASRGSGSVPDSQTEGEGAIAEALPDQLVSNAIGAFPLFAGALALLLGVLVTGPEYGWTTIKAILTQGPRRLQVLAGKLLALLLVILMIVLATFVVDALASVVVAAATDNPVRWPSAGELLVGIAAGWLIVGMWSLAGAFLGVAVRGTALAAGIGLVWALGMENLLRTFGVLLDAVDTVSHYMPGSTAGSLAAALGVPQQGQGGGMPGVTAAVGGTQAAITLGAYAAVFVAVSALLLRRRDVV